MKLRAVLFDLDGTLVDSTDAHIEAWLRAAHLAGLRVTRGDVEPLMGLSSLDIARSLLGRAEEAFGAEELAGLKDRLFMEEMLPKVTLAEGALESLRSAREMGLSTGVVSMNPRRLILDVLRLTGVGHLIDVVVGSDDVERGKPAPDALLRACKCLGVEPAECVYVGDKSYDAEAARRSGMRSILVGGEPGEADYRLASLAELPSLLRLLSAPGEGEKSRV